MTENWPQLVGHRRVTCPACGRPIHSAFYSRAGRVYLQAAIANHRRRWRPWERCAGSRRAVILGPHLRIDALPPVPGMRA